jgi:GT2 family glycosyltransferase
MALRSMDLSIVIVSWNSEHFIAPCLRSILEGSAGLATEVILVDNASSDRTVAAVRSVSHDIVLIANRVNRGFAAGTNQGISRAEGRFVLLLNPDVVILDGALEKMVGFLADRPDAGALGPQLLNPDGSVQPSCREFIGYEALLWEVLGLSRLFSWHPRFGRWRMGHFDHRSLREVDQPMASCLLVRREVIAQVGLMDERFPMFLNDVDWCYRIKAAGWKILFYPEAQVLHHLGQSTRLVKRQMIRSAHQSLYHFFCKYRRGRLDRLLRPLLWVGLLLTAVLRAAGQHDGIGPGQHATSPFGEEPDISAPA